MEAAAAPGGGRGAGGGDRGVGRGPCATHNFRSSMILSDIQGAACTPLHHDDDEHSQESKMIKLKKWGWLVILFLKTENLLGFVRPPQSAAAVSLLTLPTTL